MPSHSIFPNHILDGDDHLHEEDNLSYPADYPPALMGVVTEKEFDQLISYVNKQLAKPEASGKIPTWVSVCVTKSVDLIFLPAVAPGRPTTTTMKLFSPS